MPKHSARTSVFENKSLSMNSETPICLTDASANAIPTVMAFSFFEIFIDIMRGEERRSECVKSRSSTSCRLPGDAYEHKIVSAWYCWPIHNHAGQFSSHTFLDIWNLEVAFFFPPSGAHISIRNCLAVNASRRKVLATVCERFTVGRLLFRFPQCFITE